MNSKLKHSVALKPTKPNIVQNVLRRLNWRMIEEYRKKDTKRLNSRK